MEITTYKTQNRVPDYVKETIPNDVIERKFIIDFLEELPLEKLKSLVQFKQIDPTQKETYKYYADSDVDKHLLLSRREILMTAQITL